MDDDPPVCPGCGAVAEFVHDGLMGCHWETVHADDCSWMLDPESEAYS